MYFDALVYLREIIVLPRHSNEMPGQLLSTTVFQGLETEKPDKFESYL